MERRITQRDIAREASVDVSTVSLCLNRHPRIPETTRERVLAIAERLGYRPDPALSSIAASRWSGREDDFGVTLAFIVDDLSTAEIELKLYLEGAYAQAQTLGYHVTTLSLKEYPNETTIPRIIRNRGIRGIIVGQSRQGFPEKLFQKIPIPMVHCGYLREISGDVVRPNLRQAVEMLIDALRGSHRKICCFLPIEKTLRSDVIILGSALALARTLPRGQLIVQPVPPNFTEKHLSSLTRQHPTAIITINERHARRIQTETSLPPEYIHTLHTLPPTSGKQGIDLSLSDVGRASVNLLEIKLRNQPLATEPFHQSLLVSPRLLAPLPMTL